MSPTTLIVVRAMSRIRSTPMIIAIVSGSTFTAASTPINNGKDPPGTPAAPTAVITLRIMTTTCWDNVRDRKSTRLNSSHGYISYAVFCLKKKKKNQDRVYIQQYKEC